MTRTLGRVEGSLARFFVAPQPLAPLVGCRIVVGLSLFFAYAWRAPDVPAFFGPHGLAGRDFYGRNPFAPPLVPELAAPLRIFVTAPADAFVWIAWALLLIAALAFAAGLRTRASGALLLVLHLFFFARNRFVFGDWPWLATPLLLYTLAAPTGRRLSLDAWRARRRGEHASPWRFAPGWPLRLVQIHVCAMYLASGSSRFDKASWLHGDMVYVALTGMTHSRLGIDWDPFREVLTLGTWSALLLEGLAPVALWLPGVGRCWALALIGMHAGLELLTNVGFWSHVMSAGLLAFAWPRQAPWEAEAERRG
jgi:hypothetical protein